MNSSPSRKQPLPFLPLLGEIDVDAIYNSGKVRIRHAQRYWTKGPMPKYGKPMKMVQVHLPVHLRRKAARLGKGVISDGVRKALEAA